MNNHLSPEIIAAVDRADFSVRPEIIAKALRLLGNKATPESSYKWLHSRTKKILESYLIGYIGSFLSSPLALLCTSLVLASDGKPILYQYPVAFLGKNFETINEVSLPKFRSLQKDAEKNRRPLFESTLFGGGQNSPETNTDPRAHRTGDFLRTTGLDEIPQVWRFAQGRMSLIGARAYTQDERDEQTIAFTHFPNRFPEEVQRCYLTTMSQFKLDPGLIGLYTATARKDLTCSERMLLDMMQARGSSMIGEFRMTRESINVYRQGTGAR